MRGPLPELLIASAVTLALVIGSLLAVRAADRQRLDARSEALLERVVETVTERVDALARTVSSVRSGRDGVAPDARGGFAVRLRAELSDPAVLGVDVVPATDSATDSATDRAPDAAPDAVPPDAVALARDTGEAVLSASVGEADGVGSPAVVVPYYGIDSLWTLADRRTRFEGVAIVRLDLGPMLERALPPIRGEALRVGGGGRTLFERADGGRAFDETRGRTASAHRAERLGVPWEVELRSRGAFPWWPLSLLGCAVLWGSLLAGAVRRRGRAADARIRELGARDEERSGRIASLERANADLEGFARVVSHDLRTPLRGVVTLIDLLGEALEDARGDAPPDPEITEYLRRIDTQTERMDELVAGVLRHSTLAADRQAPERIDTRGSIVEVARALGVDDGRLSLTGSFPELRSCRVRFEQVMSNLIGNAFKYHHDRERARVEVSAASFGAFHVFSIVDDGPGIDAADHDRVFELFEASPVEGVESTGVGLAIVRRSVESVGGRIVLESALGRGASFRVMWPKAVATPAIASEVEEIASRAA